jgi:hypothetical protein
MAGLVHEVYAADALDAAVRRVTDDLRRGATAALETKALFRTMLDVSAKRRSELGVEQAVDMFLKNVKPGNEERS